MYHIRPDYQSSHVFALQGALLAGGMLAAGAKTAEGEARVAGLALVAAPLYHLRLLVLPRVRARDSPKSKWWRERATGERRDA